nr:hypothetical protein [Methanosarcina horonobensis]
MRDTGRENVEEELNLHREKNCLLDGKTLKWQAKTEDTVLSIFTFDPYLPSVEFNQFLDKG